MDQLEIISCDGCGACCMQQGHPPYTDEEFARVPAELKAPLDVYLAALEVDDTGQPCLWLDPKTRQCLHYEHRPQMCRDFERGSTNCHLVRWRYGIAERPTALASSPGFEHSRQGNSTIFAAPDFVSRAFQPLPIVESTVESCDDCGACCMQQGHPPYTDDEWELLGDDLRGPIEGYLAALEEDDFGQPCMWLDRETKQCLHYHDRPQVCRDFERASSMCVQLRLRYKIGGRT